MPNTLAHIGLQGPLARFAFPEADLKWAYTGFLIPDLPWILQRALLFALPGIDAITLRYYVDVQASLFGCLILCAALAMLADRFRAMFVLLAINTVLHLILDACQTKWANGVHLGAPFTWNLTNWGFFWPENPLNLVLTGVGLLFILRYWQTSVQRKPFPRRPTPRQWLSSTALFLLYLILPFFFLQGPRSADNHYLETRRTPLERTGRYVEFDRASCLNTAEGNCQIAALNLIARGVQLDGPAQVSLRGVFTSPHEIRVIEFHLHRNGFRDTASYVGLFLIVLLWVISIFRIRGSAFRVGL